MKLKTTAIIGALLIIIVLGVFFIMISSDDETRVTGKAVAGLEKVSVGYKATSHYLPIFVAKEKGYFEQEGLDAELVEFQSSNHLLDAVLTGELDAGRGALLNQFIIEIKQPGTLKTFLVNKGTTDNYLDYIIVRKDSTITSINGLKGKKIGTNEGSIESTFLKSILSENGLEEGDYEIITMKPSLLPQVLESGQIDAFMSYEPITNIALSKGFGKVLVSAPVEKFVVDPWVSGGSYMRADYIEENPEKAHKIIRAFYKAADFIAENPEECREIIAKYTPLEEDIISGLHIIEVKKPSLIKIEAQEHAEILFEKSILDARVNISSMIYEIPS